MGRPFFHIIALVSVLVGTQALAAPKNPEKYRLERGHTWNLKDGSIIQGSSDHGGMQPDYSIDLSDSVMVEILNEAKRIAAEGKGLWTTIRRIQYYIRNDVLPRGHYENSDMADVARRYRNIGADVPIGEYPRCRSGVCRENAIITSLALTAAGIPNEFVYVKVDLGSYREDHAIVLIAAEGENWIIDTYNSMFNGYRLKDAIHEGGIDGNDPHAPIATRNKMFRRIERFNDYPKIWSPLDCQAPLTKP